MNFPLLCLACVGEYIANKSKENPDGYALTAAELAENCNIAVTLAPTWAAMSLGAGQQVFGCCAAPTCPIHLNQQTPEQAGRTQSGLLVPGGVK